MASLTKPANWKALAPAPPATSLIWKGQAALPQLPVPELSETAARLKESLKPIARNDHEYAVAVKRIDEFASTIGPELHKRLLKRRDETEHWLEQWWDDIAYLGYRDSVVVNVSYYYGFDVPPAHLSNSPAARAAALTRATMLFREQFYRGEIPPESTREGPLCMDTWRWMFDCCRIPGPQGLDWSVSYKEGGDIETRHIIVLRQGRVWRVRPWQQGRLLSLDELEKQFQAIYNNTTHEYPGVGVLTSNNRDVWAKDYAELARDPHNAAILQTIQSAAFVVCLDTETPSEYVEWSRALWHGAVTRTGPTTTLGLRNRWVDKPVQYIVFDNGKAGIMGEHSIMDGTPTVTLCDRVLDMIASPDFDKGVAAETAESELPVPLDWTVSPQTQAAIGAATEAAKALVEGQTMGFLRTHYGKAAIKKFGVSPDSWAQMIVQLAYARLLRSQGKLREGGTYESATTRKFFKGRTEVIRVVSSESDAWVRAMDDECVGPEERRRLFGEAAKRHIATAKMAGNAQGVDRHLLGLKKALKEGEELPAIYTDPVYARSSNWVLSTSAIFSKHFIVYGWGEVVPEGYGVAYMTGFDDYLQFTVTSRVEMPNDKFCEEISRAAVDLYNLHAIPGAKL